MIFSIFIRGNYKNWKARKETRKRNTNGNRNWKMIIKTNLILKFKKS